MRRLTQGSISLNPAGGSQQTIHAFDNPAFVRSMDGLNRMSVQATVHGNVVSNIRKRFGRNKTRGESVLVTVPDSPTSPTSPTTISGDSNITVLKGMTPEQLEVGSRASVLLKKTLRGTNHSPFSLWPSGRRPSVDPKVTNFGSLSSLHASHSSVTAATASSATASDKDVRRRKSNSSSNVSFQVAYSSSVPPVVSTDPESEWETKRDRLNDKQNTTDAK